MPCSTAGSVLMKAQGASDMIPQTAPAPARGRLGRCYDDGKFRIAIVQLMLQESRYLQYMMRYLLQRSMSEDARASALSLVLLEQEDTDTRQHEYADAGIHGERVVYHQQRATEYRSYHTTSVPPYT